MTVTRCSGQAGEGGTEAARPESAVLVSATERVAAYLVEVSVFSFATKREAVNRERYRKDWYNQVGKRNLDGRYLAAL